MDTPILPSKRIRTKKSRVGGIYQWRQLSTGKKYIGSTKSFARRKSDHKSELKRGVHTNRHLQRAWAKFGMEDFVFEIVEIIQDESQLRTKEQWYLDNHVTWRFDFNILPLAICPPDPTGRECTPETREKLSKALTGRNITWGKKVSDAKLGVKMGPQTQEHKDKRSKARTGKKMTPEQIQKMSEARKGKKASPEAKAKMSKARKGRKMPPRTPEALANMSKAHMGKKASPEARAKMAKAQTGRKHPPEAIANMRKAQAGRKFTPEARVNMSKGQYARQVRERKERDKK